MIEVRKTTEKEKARHSNMAYVIDLGHSKQWFTEKALIELVRFSEAQVCTHDVDKCPKYMNGKKGCEGCEYWQ